MRSVYIQMGYYKTLLIEVINKSRDLKITNFDTLNCGNNFLIGRLNRVDEFAEKLATKLKVEYKKDLGNIILVLPTDFTIESVIDGSNLESKNKLKEIKQQVYKNRHTGLNSVDVMRIGYNSYNDMYLSTEYDGKRLNLLLDALQKKGIIIKQILSPLNVLHHLARSVVCPFEVINSNNNSNVVKTGVLLVNATLNRINYTLIHNNLPIEIREGSNTFVKLIDIMSKENIPFVKVVRLLSLIGVNGLEESDLSSNDENTIKFLEDSDNLVLNSLDDLETVESEKIEDREENSVLFTTEENIKKESKRVSIKIKNKENVEMDTEEDLDISLLDNAYMRFEESLSDILVSIRSELQKNLNYFINNYGVKIANIIVVSNDIKGLDEKIIGYSGLKGRVLNLESNITIEVEDFTLINETDREISSQYSLLFGAILSNNVRGNIYE